MPQKPRPRASVKLRLEQKVAVLRDWLNNGPADGRNAPTSLRQLASWVDKSLGIEKIASPNEITRGGRHGGLVQEAEELMNRLAAQRPPTRNYSKEQNLLSLRAKLAQAEQDLSSLGGRLQEARAEVLRLTRANAVLRQQVELAEERQRQSSLSRSRDGEPGPHSCN